MFTEVPRLWIEQAKLFQMLSPDPETVVEFVGHSWEGDHRAAGTRSKHDRAVYYAVQLDLLGDGFRLRDVLLALKDGRSSLTAKRSPLTAAKS